LNIFRIFFEYFSNIRGCEARLELHSLETVLVVLFSLASVWTASWLLKPDAQARLKVNIFRIFFEYFSNIF